MGHEAGSMYVPAFGAKITEISGTWDADAGADLAIDAYLGERPRYGSRNRFLRAGARHRHAGRIFLHRANIGPVVQADLSNRPPVSVHRLQHIIADLVEAVDKFQCSLREESGGWHAATYRIGGHAPAYGPGLASRSPHPMGTDPCGSRSGPTPIRSCCDGSAR